MKTTGNNKYSAPQLKVVSFKIEHGFTGSLHQTVVAPGEFLETHTVRSGWGNTENNESNTFF